MAADINKPKIRDKSVKLLRKKPKILVNKAWICRHITKYYEIFKDNDESMYTSSGSIIAITVNFDQPFDVCRQSFHHYLKVLITHLLLVLDVWDGKLTYRKSWAKNLLMWSDLTFKVKRG